MMKEVTSGERESRGSLAEKNTSERPKYERPSVRVLNEEEILSAFQVVQAGGSTWWVP
jgi:hypothetical protein